MEIKAVTVQVETQVNMDKREVTAYASTFGNVDRAGDIMHPGAFTKTLKEGPFAQGRAAYKYNHEHLIGRPIHAEEDTKGLLTVAKVSKTPLGDEKLALMADGSLPTYSIKYEKIKGKYDFTDGIRNLREIKLYEFGPVDPDLACNPQASIISVKAMGAMGDSGSMGFCSIYDYTDALSSYLRGLQAKDQLTTAEIAMLDKAYQEITAAQAAMKSLLEPAATTPEAESVIATLSKESSGDSNGAQLLLALATAARGRMALVERTRR